MPFCYGNLSRPLIRPRFAHPPSPQGEGSRTEGKPSPQEKVARRAGRGVPRRAFLPAKRPSNNVPSKPSPQEKVARRAGRGVPRRAFLPRKGHRTMSPHPASLRSPTFPPRGRQSHRGQAFPFWGTKPWDVQPSPQGARSAGCRGHPRAVARRAGRGVPRRAYLPAKRPSNNVPSSGLASLTHLSPRGRQSHRGQAFPSGGAKPRDVQPSPQEKVARRAGRGVLRRASLPAKRPSNNVPSKPSPQGKVPNEERRKRCSAQGVPSRERAIEQCPLIRPRFAHPPSPQGARVGLLQVVNFGTD